MDNIVLQIERLMSGSVPDGGNVIYNTVVYTSENISYEGMSGIVTLNTPGTYKINWWVATLPPSRDIVPVFKMFSSKGDTAKGDPPDAQGKVVGSGIVKVGNTRVTVRVTNISAGEITYPDTVAVKAGLTISMEGPGPASRRMPAQVEIKEAPPPTALQATPGSIPYFYSTAQLSYVLDQLIRLYTDTWTVYTNSLYAVTGKPKKLQASLLGPDDNLLVLLSEGELSSVPLSSITAVCVGDGTVYDPSIVYLPPSELLPPGYEPNPVSSIQNLLALNTDVSLLLGASVRVSGLVYKNEFGLLVLSDVSGNTPVFVPYNQIQGIFNAESKLNETDAVTNEKQWRRLQRSLTKVQVTIENPIPKK